MTETAKLPLTIRGVNLPIHQGLTYAIGFDWVQYSGVIKPGIFPEIFTDRFKLVKKDYGTRNFNELYDVVMTLDEREQVCAQVEAKARVKFIKGDIVLIKLDNKFCYNGDVQTFIQQMNDALGITFKNFTRLDTFIDFQQIGKTVEIQKFLLACASRQLVVKGKSMRTHHERELITGITWGSSSSPVSFTMYNKSREMRKKTQKPWINALWDECGFDENKDTYRLEFRHRKDLKTFVDCESEDVLFSHTDIKILSCLQQYVTSLYHTHFCVGVYDAGVRFSRLRRFYPLDMEATMIVPVRLSQKEKSSNYIKCQIKNTITDALLYQQQGDKIQASGLFEYIERLLFRHDLYKWYKQKYAHINLYKSRLTIFDMANMACANSHQLIQGIILN